jgi:hypothetical protein
LNIRQEVLEFLPDVVRGLYALIFLVAGLVGSSAGPLLSVGSTNGAPGATVNVAINYITDGTITGLNFDLLFSTNYLQTGTPVAGNAIPNPFFGFNTIAPGQLRILSIAFPTAVSSNGVVTYIPFVIASNAPDQLETLTFTNVAATDAGGNGVALPSANGVLAIVTPPQITGISSAGGVVHLTLTANASHQYQVQAATNLSAPQWITFTNLLTGPNPVFDDVSASNLPARFYRALIAPF